MKLSKYASLLSLLLAAALWAAFPAPASGTDIIFLHHSTGEGVYYGGGVPEWISDYNTENGSGYRITERNYPDSPYDWANYPYDYWNL